MGGKSWLLDELCNDLPSSTENNYWCYFLFQDNVLYLVLES